MKTTPPLADRPYKKRFPFRLSVPSFVYPADYATNVRLLGPFVDEIELLLFESDDPSLPSEAQIGDLGDLADKLDLSFNVHLPLDLDIGAPDNSQRKHAVARLALFIKQVAPLSPTTHTLHLQCNVADQTAQAIQSWQARTLQSLDELFHQVAIPARSISVETLDYTPARLLPFLDQCDLAVCVDVGHVLRYGFDLAQTLRMFEGRIAIFHLHGVADGTDHLSLTRLDPVPAKIMQDYLVRFNGTVSLEMFSLEKLRDSLPCLAAMMAAPEGEG